MWLWIEIDALGAKQNDRIDENSSIAFTYRGLSSERTRPGRLVSQEHRKLHGVSGCEGSTVTDLASKNEREPRNQRSSELECIRLQL